MPADPETRLFCLIGGPMDAQTIGLTDPERRQFYCDASPAPDYEAVYDRPCEYRPIQVERYERRGWVILDHEIEAFLHEREDPRDAFWDVVGLHCVEAIQNYACLPLELKQGNRRGARRLCGRLWFYYETVWLPAIAEHVARFRVRVRTDPME